MTVSSVAATSTSTVTRTMSRGTWPRAVDVTLEVGRKRNAERRQLDRAVEPGVLEEASPVSAKSEAAERDVDGTRRRDQAIDRPSRTETRDEQCGREPEVVRGHRGEVREGFALREREPEEASRSRGRQRLSQDGDHRDRDRRPAPEAECRHGSRCHFAMRQPSWRLLTATPV
jgi:hypothetical protein